MCFLPLGCVAFDAGLRCWLGRDRCGYRRSASASASTKSGSNATSSGFVAFEEKDAGVFFGRDREITEYLDELNRLKARDRAQPLVICGGSGSGKSSLLKAGLIPRLRQQPDWFIIPPFDLSREPIDDLFDELWKSTGVDIDLPTNPPPTVEGLTELLTKSLRAIEKKKKAWLLLQLDQAEVLLAGTKGGKETDASLLLAAVGRVLGDGKRKLVAVFTIRTGFMPALDRALPEVGLRDRSLRSITALSEIIEKPAARFGIKLEEGLSGRMVEDTRGADALPLLAYTPGELYEKGGDDKILTVTEYEQLGGVEGAIARKLHEEFSDPVPTVDELAAFRRCFVRQLVRVDENAVEGKRYLRAAVACDALPAAALRLVERLKEARLLVGSDDGKSIAIAHERLIRDWADAPFQTWLSDDKDNRRLIDNLKALLAVHRDGGPFLSDKPLLDAQDLLEREPSIKDDEPELAQFTEDSISAERERAQAAEIEQGKAWMERADYYKVQPGKELYVAMMAARAIGYEGFGAPARRDGFPYKKLFRSGTADYESAFRDAAAFSKYPKPIWSSPLARHHESLVRSVAFSPDWRTLASGSDDKTIKVWDLESGTLTKTLSGHTSSVRSVAFSPDGNTLASGSDDTTIWG